MEKQRFIISSQRESADPTLYAKVAASNNLYLPKSMRGKYKWVKDKKGVAKLKKLKP